MSTFISWHLLDIFFMLLGCYFVIRGAFRGLVGETLSLGGLILSVYFGFRYSGSLGKLLSAVTGLNKEAAQVLSVVLVWIFISIGIAFLRMILKKVVDFASLGGLDRILGLLCGLFKTLVVIYAVLIGGLLLAPVAEPTWMSRSDALVYAGRWWPEVRSMLINTGVLPRETDLPDGTLEQILRPYRRGVRAPGYGVPEARAFQRRDTGQGVIGDSGV